MISATGSSGTLPDVHARRLQRRQQADRQTRQRTEEDGVHHAEERDVRADPEREAENGDEREAWRLEQLADGVAQGSRRDLRFRLMFISQHSSSPADRSCTFSTAHR